MTEAHPHEDTPPGSQPDDISSCSEAGSAILSRPDPPGRRAGTCHNAPPLERHDRIHHSKKERHSALSVHSHTPKNTGLREEVANMKKPRNKPRRTGAQSTTSQIIIPIPIPSRPTATYHHELDSLFKCPSSRKSNQSPHFGHCTKCLLSRFSACSRRWNSLYMCGGIFIPKQYWLRRNRSKSKALTICHVYNSHVDPP